jgi:hypothetical protein
LVTCIDAASLSSDSDWNGLDFNNFERILVREIINSLSQTV